MEKHDETCETNNIVEEKTLSILSDSAGIEKVASEATFPDISTEISSLNDELSRLLESVHACQSERMLFSHLDENRDGKVSPAELRQCLEAISVELSEQELVAILDPYYGGGLLEPSLWNLRGTRKLKGIRYLFSWFFRMDQQLVNLSPVESPVQKMLIFRVFDV
ncbi:uncharacterized protein LOC131609730 isoform X1 [Vicia villosa]|uniref:uncharacterized protein LOC131609730 isoform X1 n=1 Tax=Vicia villosa TaxID=3911 RepID=UPI00273C4CBD|nr:uncharacterized protein LOC131609730 isoform X1 [Vicia villosa]